MKIIETERLILREFEEADLKKMIPVYSDEDVMRYIGRGGPVSGEQAEKMLQAFMNSYKENGYGLWALVEKSSGDIIGHCGLNTFKDKSYTEVAYLLRKESWGKGYATESAKASLDYGFETAGLERIIALTYPDNKPSQNVVKKIGLEYQCDKEFIGINFMFFSKDNPKIQR